MNKTKQFWALLKFQSRANPFVWMSPLVFGTPFLLSLLMPVSYVPSLSSVLPIQNLFFVGLYGVWIIAPEMNGNWGTTATCSPGTEFLITRAIDRPVLYRTRVVLLYLLILALPLASLLHSFGHPNLKVREYSNVAQQECLSHVPGTTLMRDPDGSRSPIVSMPHGNVLVEAWHVWVFVVSALAVQALLLSLYSLKHRTAIFYVLFMGFAFAPLLLVLRDIGKETPGFSEHAFFVFAGHPTLAWTLTGLAMVVGELWCERRFARLEQ